MTISTATIASTSTGTLSSPGIGSGLDVNSIVSQLMAVENQPLTNLNTQEAAYQAKISAYGNVSGALSTFESAVSSLTDPKSFQSLATSVGDSSVLSASAATPAVSGSYSVEVTQLAQAQKLTSSGFASTTTAVGSGTLTFGFGTFDGTNFTPNGTTGSQTVTIGSGQGTLAGIRDAVNAANIGVTATIVNDGSASGNRLVFTSTNTGASNSIKVTVADSDGNNTDASGLSQLAYDPAAAVGAGKNLVENVKAQDALLNIDGIAVSKPTNSVTDAIQGVTLNLLKTNIGAPTTLSVSPTTSSVASAVQGFVTAYNALNTTLVNLTAYNASTQQGSVLTGDSSVRLIQSQLRTIIGSALSIAGSAGSTYNSLSAVGVTFQQDGSLSLDTAKLNSALSSNPAAVGSLFASVAQASDSLTTVTASGTSATPGNYAVNISQIATQGSVAGSDPAALTITAGVNDQLTVSIDGASSTVTLAAGTYASADALAAEVQSTINGASSISQNGSSVKVSVTGGVMSITSNRYGSTSAVSASGSSVSTLLGSASTTTAGVDVAGTIGGLPALGSGQSLSGPIGSPINGIQLQITGGATGARGNVTYTQGIASQLNQALTQMLASNGIVAASTDGVNRSVQDIDQARTTMTAHLAIVQAQYTAQFSALDTLLSSMSSTSSYLTQQLANLPGFTNNSKN